MSGGQPPEVFLQILSSLGPPELALGFALRSQVRIQGLVSKPQFNGKLATVLGAQGSERVQVRMPDGTEMALKPCNLEAFVAEVSPANLDSA